MSRRHIAFHERGWESFSRAEARAPHPPTEMLSGNDRGPIQMWVCGMPHCNEIRYSYNSSAPAPLCTGGLYFSFITAGAAFDPSIHTLGCLR
jgi:hypothetical protein